MRKFATLVCLGLVLLQVSFAAQLRAEQDKPRSSTLSALQVVGNAISGTMAWEQAPWMGLLQSTSPLKTGPSALGLWMQKAEEFVGELPEHLRALEGNGTDPSKLRGPIINTEATLVDDDTLSEEAWEFAEPKFEDLDSDHDEIITPDEAATFGTKNGVPWSEIKPIFKFLDKNHDKNITEVEFDNHHPISKRMLEDFRTGFADIDLDGNNMISSEEWRAFCHDWMRPHPTPEKCNTLFKDADTRAPKDEIDRIEFEVGAKACTANCVAMLQGKSKQSKKYSLKGMVHSKSRPPTAAQQLGAYVRRWTAIRRAREAHLSHAVLAD